MGLLKNFETDSGIVVENAYHRIEALTGTKIELSITVVTYISQEAANSKKSAVSRNSYSFVPVLEDTVNFIAQGYAFLKTLSNFAEAVDA